MRLHIPALVFLFFIIFVLTASSLSAHSHCEFRLGFKTLRDLIGHDIVGECLESEHYNAIGDSNQRTTGGLMAWRKADNWTAFTDGYRTWINGPNGLVQRLNTERFEWEADRAESVRTSGCSGASPNSTSSPSAGLMALSSLGDFVNGRWLEQQHPQLAVAIKNLGWARDGIDDRESEVIQDLLYIVVKSRSVAASIVSLDWVQDCIDDVEAEAISWLKYEGSAKVASSVVSLGWVQDDIDETEVKAIQQISYIDYADSEVASLVVSLGWVQDGIENLEVDAIQELAWLTNNNAEGALRIVGMPFLAAIEPPDVSALVSLRQLAAFRPEAFAGVMSHTALRDGIADEVTPIVATLYGVATTNSSLIGVLLNRSRILLERRIIALPLSGEVILDIIRTAPGAARSMNLLERSVREAEAFMGVPFPTKHVVLLYENAVIASFAGANFGTHIAIRPQYDSDDDSHEAAFAGHNKRSRGGALLLERQQRLA